MEYTPGFDDEMVNDNFDDKFEDDLQINCGIVSILLAKYDRVLEVYDTEGDDIQDEAPNQKPLCYYVMNNGVVEEQQAIFERPNPRMMYHLKPLFIRANVDGITVNKVFVDVGTINLMQRSLFKKIGKTDKDFRPHNMVLSNYEGKTRHILGVIQMD